MTKSEILAREKFERIEAVFVGAGDTLSAALAALIANGSDLGSATREALLTVVSLTDSTQTDQVRATTKKE